MALNGEKLVGTIGLEDRGNNQGYLKRMYIDKNYRGTGLSSKLVEQLLEFARSKGYKAIYLSTSEAAERAIGFYTKNGYERVNDLPDNFEHHPADTVFFRVEI
jgi:ribosomal protein S18 acetylase RimI-like enzyme